MICKAGFVDLCSLLGGDKDKWNAMPTGTNAFFDAMLVFQCVSGDSPFLGFCRVSGTRGFHRTSSRYSGTCEWWGLLEFNGRGWMAEERAHGADHYADPVNLERKYSSSRTESHEAFVNSDLLNNMWGFIFIWVGDDFSIMNIDSKETG